MRLASPLRLACAPACAAVLASGPPAAADTLLLPAAAMPATGPVIATWRPEPPAPGALTLEWSDAAGRLVEQHRAEWAEARPEVAAPLDLAGVQPGSDLDAEL